MVTCCWRDQRPGRPQSPGLRAVVPTGRRGPGVHRAVGGGDRARPSRVQPRCRRAHPGHAPGVRLTPRHPLVGHRPSGLRAQDRDGPAGGLHPPAPGRAALSGYPSRARVRARLDREQPRLDGPVLRPRAGRGRRDGRHRPQGGRRDRRRVDDRRDGLRGAQQPRPLRQAGRDRPQRQRPVLCPDRVAAVGGPPPVAAAPRPQASPHPPRAGAPRPARPSGPSPTPACRACTPPSARCSSRTPSSRRSACATPGRSTATTSRRRGRAPGRRRRTRIRSSSTSSPRRARATHRPRTTTRRACTTWRRVRPGDRAAGGLVGAQGVHAGVQRGADRGGRPGPAHPRHHRGDARADRAAAVPGRASPTASTTWGSPSSTP